mmetsp:Transcript_37949/g.94151  ORF Transcript_37949/g.94151 Transcript_37949/m.94151 type:complete len:161 (-) Transcript_37949:243-725(-)
MYYNAHPEGEEPQPGPAAGAQSGPPADQHGDRRATRSPRGELDSQDGIYNGKRAHAPDLEHVLRRAAAAGVTDLIVTAGSLDDSRRALALVRSLRASSPVRLSCTVGVHPTRCDEFEQPGENGAPPTTAAQLLEMARDGMADGSVVAIGEIGLDYDRLHF